MSADAMSDDSGETVGPTEGEILDAEPAEDAASDAADETTALQAEVADLKDRLARARADYVNLQKRVERDAAAERDRVKARVLEGFLQVYEYGQMAAFEAERNPGPLAEGVKMIVREFDRLLEDTGVKPIGAVGDKFDRDLHEAFATEMADGVPAGHISRVIATGYKLGDRVLRYAKVAVTPEDDIDVAPHSAT